MAALPEAIIIRKALEETTARLAAERATASQILALRAILERQREANTAGDSDDFHQADEAFHATIADIAGHPGIWKLIQQVKVHVDRYRRLTLPQIGRIAQVITEHEAILSAIEAHDPVRRRDRDGPSSRTAARQYLRHAKHQSGVFRRTKLTIDVANKEKDAAAKQSRAKSRTGMVRGR